ncbi:MAG: MFS transporter [Bdellovibrio sp.]|nr:MFS transporter [Bdellovibrio sp.]
MNVKGYEVKVIKKTKSTFDFYRPAFYGMAELSPTAMDIFLKVYLLLYFNQVMGLSASLTSLVIGLGVLWDAAVDPWIGTITDRYYQKHGNRQPILYVACFCVAALFFILWRLPTSSHLISYLFVFVVSALLNSAISFFSVPFYAVANDLQKDNGERKKWIGWRLIFFNIGSLVGLSVPAYFLTQSKVELDRQPYLSSVTVMTIMMIVLSCFSAFAMYYKVKPEVKPLKKYDGLKLREVFKDKIFVQILAAYFIVNCGLGLNSSLALYYYKEFLQFTEKQTQTILISFLILFTLSIPLWVVLIRFFSKKKLIVFGALTLGIINVFSFPFFQNDQFWLVFFTASILGGLLVGVAVVMEIYLSDYLNEKEKILDQSVSGQFLGLWKMASKISRAIAIGLAGPIIEISTGHPQALANYFGWGVGLFFILSALIILFPVSDQKKISNF